MSTADIAGIVDLDRYPVAVTEAAISEEFVREGRRRLAAEGVLALPGFIRPGALATMQAEADALCSGAFRRVEHRNGFPSGMGATTRVSLGCVGYDQMPAESLMRRLFLWDGLTHLVAGVLDRRPCYRSADPIASCMVTELAPGDELGWHFDANDGIVTLMLRSAGAGGAFEYAPNVRHRDDLPAIIEGTLTHRREDVLELDTQPGTLTLFNGFQSLHRVAPVAAAPSRLMLVFSYDSAPGQVFGEAVRMRFFGRRVPLVMPAAARGLSALRAGYSVDEVTADKRTRATIARLEESTAEWIGSAEALLAGREGGRAPSSGIRQLVAIPANDASRLATS